MTARLVVPHRVLFAVTSVVDLEHIAAHVDHLVREGWLVDVMVCEGAPSTLFPHAALHCIDLRRGHGPMAEARALQRTTGLLRELRPDVVIAATSAAAPLALTAARAARVPHRIYWIWAQDPLVGEGSHRTRRLRRRAAESAASRAATATLAASAALADDAATRSDQRPLVLGYGSVAGVDLDIFYPADQAPAPARDHSARDGAAPTALILGPLAGNRGLDLLTEMWPQVCSRLPGARLWIAGDPDPRDPPGAALDFLAGHPGVELLGRVEDTSALLRRTNVVLVPDPQGAAMADRILEAAATAVPAVAWDCPGNRDVIIPGETGILCASGAVGTFADAVAMLLGDTEQAQRMGASARSFVAHRYDSAVVAELLAELLRGLVGNTANVLESRQREEPAALTPDSGDQPLEINLSDRADRSGRRARS